MSSFREFLTEGRIRKFTNRDKFIKAVIDGTGGQATPFIDGKWSDESVDVKQYFKNNKDGIVKMSGQKYEWISDTGYIENT